MNREDVIFALRCTSKAGSECKGADCPYFEETQVGGEYYYGCDPDQIAMDAADMLEETE